MARKECPDCHTPTMEAPDIEGWQMCSNCGADFAPDYEPGDDDADE